MELKRKIIENSLLEARAEALKNAESQSLRPLGKLWGMDVFTWVNPSIYELTATLSAFPFPVFLLAPFHVLNDIALVDCETLKLVQWIAQYDKPTNQLDPTISVDLGHFSRTESVAATIDLLRINQCERHIVLFVASGNEWKTKLIEFDEFVNTAKQL
jgi:hypothetical protein